MFRGRRIGSERDGAHKIKEEKVKPRKQRKVQNVELRRINSACPSLAQQKPQRRHRNRIKEYFHSPLSLPKKYAIRLCISPSCCAIPR